tara:strand:- start:770 stop:2701 length:1932 start_codon:yes stop_codon:yes gene_type:complete
MAENTKANAQEFEKAQRSANDAVKDTNDLVRNLGTIFQKRLTDPAQRFAEAMGNTVDTLTSMKGESKSIGDLLGQLAKVKKQEQSTQEKINNLSKTKVILSGNEHANVKRSYETDLKALKARKEQIIASIKQDEIFQSIKEKAKQIQEAVTLAGIIKLSISAAKNFNATLDTVGGTFGSLNVLGGQFQKDLVQSQVDAVRVGSTLQDVNAVVESLSSNFGISLDVADSLSGKIVDTSIALGISAQEGANLFGVLMQTADLSAVQAEKLTEGAFQLARANGVAPQAVLKDVAQSSETIAKFTKGAGENLFEAAIQARQFGLNIDGVAKAARGVLNFQQSIQAETTASVLLGKTLNLQRARELALSKDLVGFQKELKNQLAGVGKFTELNVFEQEALADALNMSVSEVAQLANGTKTLQGALRLGGFDDLAGQEALGVLTQLTAELKAIGIQLTNTVGPALLSILGPLKSIIETVGTGIQVLKDFGALGPVISASIAAMAAKSMIKLLPLLGVQSALFTSKVATSFAATGPLAIPLAATALAGLVGLIAKARDVSDFKSGPGGINFMSGPAGSFKLNPRDSVLATTNSIPVNDMLSTPAGGIQPNSGGGQLTATAVARGSDIHFVVNNRPLTGGDSGYSSFFKGS